MSNAATALADLFISNISQKYATKALARNPQLVTVDVDGLSEAFRRAYIDVKENFSDRGSDDWPEVSDSESVQVFRNAAIGAMNKVHSIVKNPNAWGAAIEYTPRQTLTWWMPHQIHSYISALKGGGIDVLERWIKSPSFVRAGSAFARTGDYQKALNLSADLQVRNALSIEHLGGQAVGSARASAMVQAVQRFGKKQKISNFINQRASTNIEDWLGQISLDFELMLDRQGLASIRARKPDIKVGIAHLSLNKPGDQSGDFKVLRPHLINFFQELVDNDLIYKKWEKIGAVDSITEEALNLLTNIFLDIPKTRPKRRPKPQNALYQKGTSTTKRNKNVTQKKKVTRMTVAQSRAKREVNKESDLKLETLLQSKIYSAVTKNMGQGPEPSSKSGPLNWQTGTFARSVKLRVGRTHKTNTKRIWYDFEQSPYAVFDSIDGKYPWKTPGRDPGALIRKSIREIAKGIIMDKYTMRRVR